MLSLGRKPLGITPGAVSQHLRILRKAGLVTPERCGYIMPHRLNPEALENWRALVVAVLERMR